MKYQTGQVVFFNLRNSLFSKVIKFYNRKVYGVDGWTHVGIITKVKKDSVQIHEAIGEGFVKSDYPDYWLNARIKEKKIAVKKPKGRLTAVEKNANKYLGEGYGYFDIFLITINFLFGFKFGGSNNKLICSEAVARILYDSSKKRIDFEKEYNIPFDLVTPMHIFNSIYLL